MLLLLNLLLFLCFTFIFIILSCMFNAALWSHAGKGLASWPCCVWCFLDSLACDITLCFCHFPILAWVRCNIWLYRFLMFAFLVFVFRVRVSLTNLGIFYSYIALSFHLPFWANPILTVFGLWPVNTCQWIWKRNICTFGTEKMFYIAFFHLIMRLECKWVHEWNLRSLPIAITVTLNHQGR